MRVIITSGYFNPIHSGHINLLREAKQQGDFLYVIVNNDKQTKEKGSAEFMPEHERLAILDSLKYVDQVALSVDKDRTIAQSLREAALKFKDHELFFAKGGDRNADNIPESEKEVCSEFNIQVINGIGGGKVQSSSWLIEKVINKLFSIKMIQNKFSNIKSIEVLGNKIAMVQIPDVIELMDFWITNEPKKTHWIVATGMHGVVEAAKNKKFQSMLNSADMWVADGISLVWMARLNGFHLKRRVAGPDLFHAFLQFSAAKKYSHYFFGDTDETLTKLKDKISKEIPEVKVESFSPPFRKLTTEEDEEIIRNINEAKPDVLWVALGLPKQETWIFEHKDRLKVPVVIGVGAAFKFEAGMTKRAPAWVGNSGFEWLWRLFSEPKTTWKRVVFDMPFFLFLIFSNFFKFRKN